MDLKVYDQTYISISKHEWYKTWTFVTGICLPAKLFLLKLSKAKMLLRTFVRDRVYERNYETLADKLQKKHFIRLLAYFFLLWLYSNYCNQWKWRIRIVSDWKDLNCDICYPPSIAVTDNTTNYTTITLRRQYIRR